MNEGAHKVRLVAACFVMALVSAAFIPMVALAAAPGPPSGLVVAAGASSPVVASLSWTASADPSAVTYIVYAAVSASGPYRFISTSDGTSFLFTDAVPGMVYYFQVAATNEQGEESARVGGGPISSAWTTSPHATRSGDAFQCMLCHNNHSCVDTSGLLFRWEIESSGSRSMCLSCHSGRVSNAANVASGTSDSFGLVSGHTLDASSTGRAAITGCATCHERHAVSDDARMLPSRHINDTTVTAAGRSLCESCHDESNSFFGTGYPSVSNPTYDATGYPVSGTWPGPAVYESTSSAHAGIPATTQTAGPGTPVRFAAGDCLYCHAAHRGPNAYDGLVATFTVPTFSTLASDQAEGSYAALCLGCHRDGAPSAFTTAPADIRSFITTPSQGAGHRIKTAGGLLPVGAPLPCFECHGPHGSTRNNARGLSDVLGADLNTSSSAGVRAFCFTCHTTSDTARGWDSGTATFTAVSSTATVVGLRRDGGSTGIPNALRLPVGQLGHAQADSVSCYSCHGGSYDNPGDHNVHNPSLGGYDEATHRGAPLAQTITIAGTAYPDLPCSECHSLELGVEHAKPSSSSAPLGCSACHTSPRDSLVPSWDKTTCAQGGCHVPFSSSAMHLNVESAHALPASPCTTAGCHDTDLADIHSGAATTVAGPASVVGVGGVRAFSLSSLRRLAGGVTLSSCQVCHAAGVPATSNCTAPGCHAGVAAGHSDPDLHAATLTTSTVTISGVDLGVHACTDCHDVDLTAEHAKPTSSSAARACRACHPSPADSAKPWDKSCVTAGCHTPGSADPMHSSIDASHAIPASRSGCLDSGCHDTSSTKPFAGKSVAEIHASATTTTPSGTRTSCRICHAAGVTLTADCLSAGCHPSRANPHGYDAATHTGSPAATTFTISGATYPLLACANCHSTELGVEHTKPTSAGDTGCSECHAALVSQLPPPWDKATCAQGGCHTPTSTAPLHARISSAHARLSLDDACFVSGCHAEGNLASIHAEATGTVAGQPRTSCMLCHATGVPATGDCTVCHADKVASHYDAATHTATVATATITILGTDFANIACADCHPLELGSLHLPPAGSATCSTCHAALVPALNGWSKGCVQGGCHTVGSGRTMHVAIDADHAVGAQTCTASGCHAGAGNLAAIHSVASTTTAGNVTRVSCQICHAAGRTPSTTCSDCHETNSPHGDNWATHQALPASQTITISNVSFGTHACSECHAPTNLLHLHDNACSACHPASVRALGGWDGGCVQGGCHTTGSGHAMHASIDATHAIPADKAACLAVGCHDATGIVPFASKSIAEIHSGAATTTPSGPRASCQICHAAGVTPTADCLSAGCHPDRANPHGYVAATHTATVTTATITILGTDFTNVACVSCHSLSLGSLHLPPAGSATCSTCHAALVPALSGWARGCVQGGCHTAGSGHAMHGAIDADHVRPAQPAVADSCFVSGCHTGGTSLADIHSNKQSCATCHGPGKTPTADCEANGCHADLLNAHPNHASSGGSDFVSVGMDNSTHDLGYGVDTNCSACHITNLVALHANSCTTCHSTSARAAVKDAISHHDTNCTTCHPSEHVGAIAAHETIHHNGGCGCHDSDPYEDPTQISCTRCHTP